MEGAGNRTIKYVRTGFAGSILGLLLMGIIYRCMCCASPLEVEFLRLILTLAISGGMFAFVRYSVGKMYVEEKNSIPTILIIGGAACLIVDGRIHNAFLVLLSTALSQPLYHARNQAVRGIFESLEPVVLITILCQAVGLQSNIFLFIWLPTTITTICACLSEWYSPHRGRDTAVCAAFLTLFAAIAMAIAYRRGTFDKERIATHLIASNYTNHRSLRLLLVGSPGGPQTCICRSVAECRGIPFEEVDMSGVENTIDVIGLDSSYDASDSGMFVKKFYQAGTSEMVICLKNINNMGTSEKDGNPAMALLNVISRDECYDAFLETSIDTSNTIWIATATCLDDVPPYLRSQFEVIAIGDPSDDDRVVIAERYIIPQILEKFRIQSELLNFRKEAIWEIIQQYCSDYGMKMATQNIEAIVTRILAMREDTEKNSPFTVTPEFVRSVLEPLFNEHDPALVFARNKERFSDTVRAEIKDLLNRLSSRVMKPEEKETLMRRIRYLTTLIPEDNGFGQFDGKRFFNRVDATHYGMEEAKRQIAHTLNAKALQKGSLSSVRFLLVGPAGTGKTSICKSLADSLSLPHIKISLNGVSDECALKGTSPAYLKADAGEPVRGLYHMGGGGVIQLDEVDKMGCHNGVKVSNTLLDLLDDSGEFTDRFLGVPIDIKNVLFIGTANDISGMEPWLLDRFTVIFLEGYTRKDKEHILTEYLIPRLEREYPDLRIAIRPAVVQSLVKDYCPSLGVRDLERAIRKLVEDKLYECPEEHNVQIESEDIIRCLGAKPLPRGNLLRKPVPGYAKALAVTGGGTGLTFSVESVILPGSDELCITGLAQESTVDSVKLAKTYIQTHYLDGDEFGLHLHFGEGAMEKDGPSGGIAILISIISAVFHTSITCNAAFTGEIDLFGNVFPVGGILTKI